MNSISETVAAAIAGLTSLRGCPNVDITPGRVVVMVDCSGRSDGLRLAEVDTTVNQVAFHQPWDESFLVYDIPSEMGEVGSYHRRAVVNGVQWDVWTPLADTASLPVEWVSA